MAPSVESGVEHYTGASYAGVMSDIPDSSVCVEIAGRVIALAASSSSPRTAGGWKRELWRRQRHSL